MQGERGPAKDNQEAGLEHEGNGLCQNAGDDIVAGRPRNRSREVLVLTHRMLMFELVRSDEHATTSQSMHA
jgi:hypothetical protein